MSEALKKFTLTINLEGGVPTSHKKSNETIKKHI